MMRRRGDINKRGHGKRDDKKHISGNTLHWNTKEELQGGSLKQGPKGVGAMACCTTPIESSCSNVTSSRSSRNNLHLDFLI